MNKRVTIQEVADQAGVSKTTVSRYLNKKYHKMSPATKKRIKAVIEELDYRPSRQAQALKSKRSYLIGVVIADISNMYASLLLKGMSQVFNQAKWQMIILDSLGEVDLENQYLERLIDQNVDGIILQPAAITSENYQFIEDMQLPLILADRKTYPSQWLTIGTDNEAVISRLFDQVNLADYQSFVVVSEVLAPVSTRQDRYYAVVTACAPAPVQLIEVGQKNWQEAILDSAGQQKTLFFCNNGRVMIEFVNETAKLVDIFLPGLEEGKILTGLDKAEDIAKFYLDLGVKIVIVKTGASGAYYATSDGKSGQVAGYQVTPIDTVGAGDGFAVGVISGLKEGLSLEDSILRGNAIGARQVTFEGDNDGLPNQEELEEFMANTKRA